jgi:hypothetical protein
MQKYFDKNCGLHFPSMFNIRHAIALWLALGLFIFAASRPLDVGRDTALYFETFSAYYTEYGVRFPDLIFDAIATVTAISFDLFLVDRDTAGRAFFLFVALIQCYLMVFVLKRKRYFIESFLIAVSYGPLIFLDIIRQGLSMLFAAMFLSSNSRLKPAYIIAAVATHGVALITLLHLPLRKVKLVYLLFGIAVLFVFYYFLFEGLLARYEYYSRTDGYLSAVDLDQLSNVGEKVSLLNVLVLLFFTYGAAVGGLNRKEAAILSALYLISIYLPLLFRVYLFYFFTLSVSRDVLIDSLKLRYLVFNFMYAAVLLNFSTKAFFAFGEGF